jgi:DNA-binding FrmR family transcriptional regulator
MKTSDPETKEALLQRLRRIEGQVRGVQAMVSADRECAEILQQMAAIRSAVQSASATIFESYAAACLLKCTPEERPERERLLSDLVTMVGKLPS